MVHLLVLIVGIFVDAYIDYRLIANNKNVHTLTQYVIREVFFIVLAIMFANTNEHVFYSWVLSHLIYWWLFDVTLNVLRRKSIFYLSDKGIDKYQRPLLGWFIFKLFLFVLAAMYFINPNVYE